MEEHKNYIVYKHTSPNNKVYIGITSKDPVRRWGVCGQRYKNNKHFWNAISLYGWENFKHEIVAEGLSQSEAGLLEQELIAQYKSYDSEFGYNIALGGQSNLMSERTKQKLSLIQKSVWERPGYKERRSKLSKQMWYDEEFRKNHSGVNAARYGKKHSNETKIKIAETRKELNIPSPNLGKHLSEETKKKISEKNKGNKNHVVWTEEEKERLRQSKLGKNNPNYQKPMSLELKEKLCNINSIPVIGIIDGEEVLFKNANEAGKALGITPTNIRNVCNGKRKTAGGYVWKNAESQALNEAS